MEEIQSENQRLGNVVSEPDNYSDNSQSSIAENLAELDNVTEGQSGKIAESDPKSLILGKFKSQDDLIKAYQDLEKLQGNQSAELGELRHNAGTFRDIQQLLNLQVNLKNVEPELKKVAEKYNTPEYFQDPSFREIYKQAYLALGQNLDTDLFVNLIEGYVSGRISAHDRAKAVEAENDSVLGCMKFDKNKNFSLKKSGKRID